jgi:DNA-binding transcriptional MerR regulator
MKHRGFLLAEICEVLDCAVHHIRYIEEQLPIISTAYDTRGRRIYSLKDVFLFSRILSMTRSRGMGLQHALDTLIRDLDRPSIDTTARFLQIRHELIKTRLQSVQAANRLAMKYELHTVNSSGLTEDDRRLHGSPVHRRFSPLGYFSQEQLLPGDSYEQLQSALEIYLDGSTSDPGPDSQSGDFHAGEPAASQSQPRRILAEGRWLVLTPDPYRSSDGYAGAAAVTPLRGLSTLEFMAEAIRAAAGEYGSLPLWVISVRRTHLQHLLGFLNSRRLFSLPSSHLVVLPQPDLEEQSIGDAGALFSVKELMLDELQAAGYEFGMIYSMEHPLIPLPDEDLVAKLMSGEPSVISAAIRRGISGELYFRISDPLPLRPAKTQDSGVNPRLLQADIASRRVPALIQSARPPAMTIRPLRWEFFPPFYRMAKWKAAALSEHMSRTHASWSGSRALSYREVEISPLFARNREEFARRSEDSGGKGGLFV